MIIRPELNCIKVGLVVFADIINNCHENPNIGQYLTFYQLLTTTPLHGVNYVLQPLKLGLLFGIKRGTVVEYVKRWLLISGTYLHVQALSYFL